MIQETEHAVPIVVWFSGNVKSSARYLSWKFIPHTCSCGLEVEGWPFRNMKMETAWESHSVRCSLFVWLVVHPTFSQEFIGIYIFWHEHWSLSLGTHVFYENDTTPDRYNEQIRCQWHPFPHPSPERISIITVVVAQVKYRESIWYFLWELFWVDKSATHRDAFFGLKIFNMF